MKTSRQDNIVTQSVRSPNSDLASPVRSLCFYENTTQWRSQPKIFAGLNILTLSEQQYFVRNTAAQSTKQQDMQGI